MPEKLNSSEQVKLIGKLATSEQTSTSEKRVRILSHVPHWKKYELAGALPSGSSSKLMTLHNQTLLVRSQLLSSDKHLRQLLLSCLSTSPDLEPAQYVLTLLYELVRDDASQYEGFYTILTNPDILFNFLSRPKIDAYLTDKMLFFLTGLMSHDSTGIFSINHVKTILDMIFSKNIINNTDGKKDQDKSIKEIETNRLQCSNLGILDALGNMTKVDSYRMTILEYPGVIELILQNLDNKTKASHLYKACVIVWLMTFNENTLETLVEKNVIKSVASSIIDCRSEKVVRVTLNVLSNIMNNDTCVESIIDLGLIQYLTILEYEKWLDPELYTEIRTGQILINNKLKQFSNFDRYCIELEKKKLKWSFLHTEKFWLENFMNFENDEFSAIKKLVKLLKTSDDPTTLAVTCFDLGEFARLHPMGKQTLSKLNTKELLMTFMTSPNRELAREALLSIQKLMLNHWNRTVSQ